jgi:hypothetical protein
VAEAPRALAALAVDRHLGEELDCLWAQVIVDPGAEQNGGELGSIVPEHPEGDEARRVDAIEDPADRLRGQPGIDQKRPTSVQDLPPLIVVEASQDHLVTGEGPPNTAMIRRLIVVVKVRASLREAVMGDLTAVAGSSDGARRPDIRRRSRRLRARSREVREVESVLGRGTVWWC